MRDGIQDTNTEPCGLCRGTGFREEIVGEGKAMGIMSQTCVCRLKPAPSTVATEGDAIFRASALSNAGRPNDAFMVLADEVKRQRRIIDKLIDAWPSDYIPVEALDGRE